MIPDLDWVCMGCLEGWFSWIARGSWFKIDGEEAILDSMAFGKMRIRVGEARSKSCWLRWGVVEAMVSTSFNVEDEGILGSLSDGPH